MTEKTSRKPIFLWADDDGPKRFEYDENCIRQLGWTVLWAGSIEEAASLLASSPVDAVLLDQMMPYRAGDPKQLVWAGCLILRWLRGAARPPRAPQGVERDLWSRTPLDVNRGVRVRVTSSYHDVEVHAAMREASNQDRGLAIVPKPTNITRLIEFLKGR